jgi:glutathione S-transferase
MLKLYGFDVSNYYNMIKHAMLLKEVEYEAVMTYPNQTPEYLAISPTGKVPALQTDKGVLIETNVILEYLDDTYPQVPLYPTDPYERGKVKELVKMIELYIELPARRCHNEAFWGVPVHEVTKSEVKRALLNGMQSLARAGDFAPYIAGSEMTAADIMFMFSIDLAAPVARKLFDIDLFEHAPGSKELMATLRAMPQAKIVERDKRKAGPAFQAYIAKAKAGSH